MRKLRLSEVKYCVEWGDCVQFRSPRLSFSGQFYWEGKRIREKGNVPTLTLKAQAAEQKTGFLFTLT